MVSHNASRLVRFGTGPLASPEIGKPRRPIEGNTEFRSANAFEGNEGRVLSGVWESTAGKFRSDTTGYIEFGYILEGQARIVDPDGTVHELRPGDPFIMPEGYKGHWEVDACVKKVYFITHIA
ncbi:cupin domain-containing protein [Bordetella hinzii]|nr:cupin domain-containing protein [Bordetella hinzii]WPL83320.1 cupin domain-containing protein [Bordetella hinzii]